MKSYQNLDNVKNRLVERWHFGMLNDFVRNEKYKAAITKAVRKRNDTSVLDIGTGTGLLAIYAKEANAKQIAACDSSPIMCEMAKEAFRRNGCSDQINLIEKHSTQLDAQSDLGGKVDLVITETMDCGVFGEGLLQTLIHAKEHLLKANGQIIPAYVKLYVAGFQSKQLALEMSVVNKSSFTETVYMKKHHLSSINDDPYDACHVEQLTDFTIITVVKEALNINLNNLDQLQSLMNGELTKEVKLAYNMPEAILDGFCVWFEMFLDPEHTIKLSTDPRHRDAAVEEHHCCWQTAIFGLKSRFTNSQKLLNLQVIVSAADGVLRLTHYYDSIETVYTGLTTPMIRFLNDSEMVNKLEYEVFAEISRRFAATSSRNVRQRDNGCIENMIDFLPVPVIGIALLKEHRLKKLYCSEVVTDYITLIAKRNCLSMDSIVFIKNPCDTLALKEQFDIIVLPLVDHYGALDTNLVANYKIFKDNKLTSNGFMVPESVDVYCNIIQSHWLRSFCRVIHPEIVDRLQIGNIINEYATTLHLDLPHDFTCRTLYDSHRMTDVLLSDGFVERTEKLFVGVENDPNGGSRPKAIHAVLFYFNIFLTPSSRHGISTKRRNSFANLGCFIINDTNIFRDEESVWIIYRQNSGVMKFDFKLQEN